MSEGPYNESSLSEKVAYAAGRAAEREAWKKELDDLAVCDYTYNPAHTPREAIQALILWNTKVALDPRVSAEASALIEQGRASRDAEVEALRAEVERLRGATPATPKAARPEWVEISTGRVWSYADKYVVATSALRRGEAIWYRGGDIKHGYAESIDAAKAAVEAAYDSEQGGGASKMPTPPEPEYLPATGFTTRGG